MKHTHIAVTQRVEVIESYGEVRDCLDQEWVRLFEQLGFYIVPVPNNLSDPVGWLSSLDIKGVVLSGGNDLSIIPGASNPFALRDNTEMRILDWAKMSSVPVIGVCRGMQMINVYLGGTLSQVKGHVATNHPLIFKTPDFLASFSSQAEVNSFHNWGIYEHQLANELNVLACSEDGVIEACRHSTLPWLGIMWHPERNTSLSDSDQQLILEYFN